MPHYNELREMEERNRLARARAEDLPLFRQELPNATKAESLRATDCSSEAKRVLDWMRLQPEPVHVHLICFALGKTPNQVSPRLGELERAGLIVPTGEAVWWEPTRRKCALWRAVEKGQAGTDTDKHGRGAV